MSKVKIHNVRLGFANNSSSTHSIIILNRMGMAEGPLAEDHGVEKREFGWDFWTAASADAKLDYLALTIDCALRALKGPEFNTQQRCSELLGKAITVTQLKDEDGFASYIDHQSMIDLPMTWDGTDVDPEFVSDLQEFLLRDDVAILGGNDNEDMVHPLESQGVAALVDLPKETSGQLVGRKTKSDLAPFWTLFNRVNGTKIRLSFGDVKPPDKSDLPELVDLKITDYCPVGCPFCYQGSTTGGQHASLEQITRVADALREIKVFEVALGGGEPTLHPDFEKILRLFRDRHIVPNFTTKLAPKREHVELCGSFAYSATSPDEVRALRASLSDGKTGLEGFALNQKATIQCVLGAVSLATLIKIISAANAGSGYPVTLLGFKSQHRGKTFKPAPYDARECLDALIGLNLSHVGIDTALAVEFEAELKAREVPSWMYSTKEGKFSMYIDLVEGKMGPSSYCDDSQYVPLRESCAEIASAFARW